MGEFSGDKSPRLGDKETKSASALPLADYMEEKRLERVKKLVETLAREGRQRDPSFPETLSFGRVLSGVVVAIVVVSLVLAAIGFVFSALKARASANKVRAEYCRSPGCSRHAGLFSTLNDSLDPCEDFGKYVCSSWQPLHSFGQEQSAEFDVTIQWLTKVDKVLQNKSPKSNAIKMASRMFNACLANDSNSEKRNRETLAHFLKTPKLSLKPGDNLQPLDVIIKFAVSWQTDLWFKLTLLKATQHRDRRILIEPSVEHCGTTITSEILSDYVVWRNFLNILLGHHNFSKDEFKIDSDVNEMLCLTLNETQQPALFVLGTIATQVPAWSATSWIRALDRSIADDQGRFTEDDVVIVSDTLHLRKIKNLTAKYKSKEVLPHLTRWLLLSHLEFSYGSAINLIIGHRSGATNIGRLFCAQSTDQAFGLPIMYKILENTPSKDINKLLTYTLVAARHAFDTSPWIDVDSQALAKLKLTYMDLMWTYRNRRNLSRIEKIYAESAQHSSNYIEYVLASKRAMSEIALLMKVSRATGILLSTTAYYHLFNSVSIAAKAIGEPFYYPDASPAILYGGLGHTFSLQLVRAFDGEGILLDPIGRFTSWWTPEFRKEYASREKCGAGSRGSIFPEVPAMEIAFRTYKENRDPLAPRGLYLRDPFSANQVFFMTLCRASCEQVDGSKASESCNKAVRNSVDFAEAFSCPVGSVMNPISKCSFFGDVADSSANREL